jgi:tRNA-uridine 2-sulfurtransferase
MQRPMQDIKKTSASTSANTKVRLSYVKGVRVWVGLSGGVDSAVSAALLQRAGAEVTGVFIKGWYPPGMPCTWAAERRDAMRVAAHLHIPFRTIDASREYKQHVIDYLVAEYRAGRTPNPDILCNKEIKFGVFYREAVAAGADYIATGHYRSGEKDQSYFLWAVPREALAKTLFPVGQYEKERVRALARKWDLPVWEKKDSQGICFLGPISVEEFLEKEFGRAPGEAQTEGGMYAGKHQGALLSTIGERVALTDGEPGPWFVRAKDVEKNLLIVDHSRVLPVERASRNISFSSPNWLREPVGKVEAQYRYRGAKLLGRIENGVFISDTPLLETPSPGQSLVFYKEGELIGGGSIRE